MFATLSDRLADTFKNLRGKGRLSEADIDATAREIRIALLEADVALPVVKEFVGAVKERARSEEVSGALNPAQQIIKIVHEELVEILGGAAGHGDLGADDIDRGGGGIAGEGVLRGAAQTRGALGDGSLGQRQVIVGAACRTVERARRPCGTRHCGPQDSQKQRGSATRRRTTRICGAW